MYCYHQHCKSVVVKEFGGYESLIVEDLILPSLDGKIEVLVKYGGLNFADLYTRQGLMVDKPLPFILGMECTGIITAIGPNLRNTDFKVGQAVVCYDHNGGMFRTKVRVEPTKCFPLPDFINFKIGAAVFVNYITAYFSLISQGNLKEGETVLILSCTGRQPIHRT
nr:synaptic vesicle membrane protein VAT-1 homolog [Leptinotarsa decemlineata]